MNEKRSRLTFAGVAAGVLAVLALAATVVRIFYAVDLSDEALYAVMPYRFVLGAKPFVDELLFQQISGFFTYPFVKVFYLLTGGTAGIILYLRFVWILFMACVALVVWLATRKKAGPAPALLIALPCLTFIYFNIPALSYNTLGIGLLTAGSFLVAWAIYSDRPVLHLAGGIVHALAVVAYPSLVIGVVATGLVLLIMPSQRRLIGRYVIGGAVIALLFAVFVIMAGPQNLLASYHSTGNLGVYGGGLNKLIANFNFFWKNYNGKTALILIVPILFLGRRSNPLVVAILLGLTALVPLSISGYPKYLFSSGYITYLCLLGPWVFLYVKDKKEARYAFWLIWFPGFCAGLTAGITSSNGFWAISIGFFQGALITLLLLWWAINSLLPDMKRFAPVLGSVALIIPVIILALTQYVTPPYGDGDSTAYLTARVPTGAYAGIYTTREKLNFLGNLENDLRELDGDSKTVMFYDALPAGYLLSDKVPLTDWAWMPPWQFYRKPVHAATINYFRAKKEYPDIIVKVLYGAGTGRALIYARDDPFVKLETSDYEIETHRHDYLIYRRTDS